MSTTETSRGWRAALTPHARASRQRWTAFYALLLVAIGVGTLDTAFNDALGDDGRGVLIFVLLIVVFGMLRRGTRRLTATDHPELDERDRRARDRAFRLAMPLFVLVVLVTIVALPAALDGIDRGALVDGRRDATVLPADGWFVGTGGLVGLLVWFALWAAFLPTGVLAWREPDAPVDDDLPAPATPELTRDVILGGAVLVAVVLTFVGLAFVGLALVAVAIAGLGAAARRGGARPAVRPRLVATIVAGVVACVLVASALGLSVGGDATSTDGDDAVPTAAHASGDARLPKGVTRWMSQYQTTCLVVKSATGADLGRRAARTRMERLGLDLEQLCRF